MFFYFFYLAKFNLCAENAFLAFETCFYFVYKERSMHQGYRVIYSMSFIALEVIFGR